MLWRNQRRQAPRRISPPRLRLPQPRVPLPNRIGPMKPPSKLAKSKIKKDGFTVREQGGIAYWDGTASVIQHKGSATRMAKAAGARAVVNNIKISDAARQKATQNLDQGRRGSKSSAANRGRNASSRSRCVHVCATLDMEFEWDENKRDRNLAVYGIDFVDAVSVWDGSEVVVHSTQTYHGEERFLATGICSGSVITGCLPGVGRSARLISARRARRNERADYNNATGRPEKRQD